MSIVQKGAAFVAGAILIAAASTSAFAASSTSQAFVKNAIAAVERLDHGNQAAIVASKSPRVRAFAESETREQAKVKAGLVDWVEGDKILAVAFKAMNDGEEVQTAQFLAADAPAADGQEAKLADADGFDGAEGRAFDALYKAQQLEILTQIQTAYEAYAADGDDAELQAFATRELPKIERRLVALKKI